MSAYNAGPRCPNHDVPLQLTNEKGIGICPISDYRFQFSYDDMDQDVKIDKYGKSYIEPKITPIDGEDG